MILVGVVLGLTLWSRNSSVRQDNLILLVAGFSEAANAESVNKQIMMQIRDASKETGRIEIKQINDSFKTPQDRERVRTLAKAHKAAILIWGSCETVGDKLTARLQFDLIANPGVFRLSSEKKETLAVNARAPQSLTISEPLSANMVTIKSVTIALSKFALQEFDKAGDAFSEALSAKPPDDPIEVAALYQYRGIAYLYDYRRGGSEDQLQKAARDYDLSIAIDRNNSGCYFGRALCSYDRNDYAAAITDCTEAIKLNARHAQAYFLRGNCYSEQGANEAALSDYQEAIRLDPMNASAYSNRADLLSDMGNYQNAISDYKHAIEVSPDLAVGHYGLARAYAKLGDRENARISLNRVFELSKNKFLREKAAEELANIE